MRIKIIVIFAFCLSTLLAQDKNNQSIELPDFVITGVQNVEIPIQKKPRPELVPTLSKNFFNPSFTPDEFLISDFSKPIKNKVKFYTPEKSYYGMFSVGAGLNTLPIGQFFISAGSNNVLFSSHIWGINIKDYEPYSDYNTSGINLKTDFFINSNSSFLPGLKISLKGNLYRDDYKFYGSNLPSNEREKQAGDVVLSFVNTLNDNVKFEINSKYSYLVLKDYNLKENLISTNGYIKFKIGKMTVGSNASYVMQSLKDYFPSTTNNYLGSNFYLKIKSADNFHGELGFHYSKQDSNSFFSPTASVSFKLENNLAVFAEYSPYSSFNTINNFIDVNRYYNIGSTQNTFTENKNNTKLTLKYQYDKYFEIVGGINYLISDNYYFFEDRISKGIFNIYQSNDVKTMRAFINFFFHLGPFGEFYSNVSYQKITDSNDNFIPYKPKIIADLVYSKNIAEKVLLKVGTNLAFGYYSDLTNSNEINNYINMFATIGYNFKENLLLKVDLENILNNENYKYNFYKEKPMDIIVGVEYRW